MKQLSRFLFVAIAALAFAAAPVQKSAAQSITAPLTSFKTTWGAYQASGAIFDTVKTTAAVYLYSGALAGVKDVMNVVVTATELTGTSGGTITLEASMDGTSWYPVYDSKDSVYSKTLADVATAQVFRWQLYDAADKYYRIKAVGSGTVSIDLRGKYNAYNRR